MTKKERRFIDTVWGYYEAHGRHSLSWRKTTNPYRILVSEVMLQQTQVERVIPKYKNFLKRFPTVQKLADAKLSEILIEWQGLGYNRRAKFLHECGKEVVRVYGGRFPKAKHELEGLPGIGDYTAAAVCVFAYNKPVVCIETNIRTVYLFHFFRNKKDVHDKELRKTIERTLDKESPREWYSALMDYGAYIKKMYGNPNSGSKHHVKQKPFKGSDREIRGAIIKALSMNAQSLHNLQLLPFSKSKITKQLSRLETEGLIKKRKRGYALP